MPEESKCVCSEGLENLLEAVRQKGSYHPTEDVKGDQKAFLAGIAESAINLAATAGNEQIYFPLLFKPSMSMGFHLLSKADRISKTRQSALSGSAASKSFSEVKRLKFGEIDS